MKRLLHAIGLKQIVIILTIFALAGNMSAQTGIHILGGITQINATLKPDNYRSFSTQSYWNPMVGLRYSKYKQQFRRSATVSFASRELNVYTYSGGLGGGTSHDINMNLSYLIVEGRLGHSFRNNPDLYLDFGIYLGTPIMKNVTDSYRTHLPFLGIHESGVNTAEKEYLNKVELGFTINTGLEVPIEEVVNVFVEVGIGVGFNGKKDFNTVILDKTGAIGLKYVLSKE